MSEIKVNAITDASGGNTTTVNGVTPSANTVRGRNLVINGAMQVAQRNTSKTGINTSQYTSVDRFEFSVGATFATFTTSQSTDAPNGFSYSAKFDCTTANASPSAGAYLRIRQKIEGQNLQGLAFGTSDAKDLSVSFWIKSNQTGNMVVNLRNFNSSQQRISNKIVSIDSANTWEYKTFTISGDTVRSIDNNNGEEFNLEFWFNAGASYTASNANSEAWIDQPGNNYYSGGTLSIGSSTDDYVNITGVQMEAGSVATEFDHKSFDTELQACRRYFCKTYNYADAVGSVGSGYWAWTKTTSQRWDIPLYQGHGMRTTPTIVAYNASTGTAGQYRNASNGTNHTVGTFQATQNMLFIDENNGNWNNLGGGSVGRMFVTADAEL